MKKVLLAGVAAACVAASFGRVAAETPKLRYVTSVYFDDKGAGLSLPEGVACDAGGRFVVADTGNDRLVRFDYGDKTVSGGSAIKIPELSAPLRVQLTSKGDIYALDGKLRRVVRLGPSGEFKATLGYEGAPPPSTIVTKSFAVGAGDNLYVLDAFSARVLVLDGQGKFQKALALPKDAGFGSDLAVDSGGTLFVIDSIRRRIFSAPPDATTLTTLGDDLSASVRTLPTAITPIKGAIFVMEGSGSTIVGFSREGGFTSRQLGMGWDEGALNHPSQMCVNDRGDVFIADRDNSRVQIFQLIR